MANGPVATAMEKLIMSSVNKVILVGRLGADPEIRYTQSGQPVGSLRLATSENWNDRDGNRQERTEWHSVTVWGKQAELCGQYLAKGRQVYVEGRLQSREYTDREGVNKRAWDVVASQIVFLGGRGEGGGWGGNQSGGANQGGWGGGQGGGGNQGGGSWGGGQGGGGNQGGGSWGGGQGGGNQGGGSWGGGQGGGSNQSGGNWGGGGGNQWGGGQSSDGWGQGGADRKSAPPASTPSAADGEDDDPIPF